MNAPLPPDWDEFEDEDGEVYYHNKLTDRIAHTHPLDGYFLELVRERRRQAGLSPEAAAGPSYSFRHYHRLNPDSPLGPEWVEYLDGSTGAVYWYNHQENLTSFFHPTRLVKLELAKKAVVLIQSCVRGLLARRRLKDRSGTH